jgi:peptide chain release factor 1
MFSKLEDISHRFEELDALLGEPDVIQNRERFIAVSKERGGIEDVVLEYRRYAACESELKGNQEIIAEGEDKELVAMAREEIARLDGELAESADRLKILLIPKDPLDEKNIVLEVRAGTGGDEAALFAATLFRMYTRYAESRRWKLEILSQNGTEGGGLKEIVALITGARVYSRLKYESGVHRVQRVPTTESQGRIHTSAVTVAILPEVDEVDVEIETKDLRIDTYRASGAGGQHINKTDSAVRITHLPTGVVSACQDERSQLQNRVKAMKILRARLHDIVLQKRDAKLAAERKDQVGSGDRSQRIRTYNFPQNRITDHRIGLTLYKLETFIEGEMTDVIDALQVHFQAEAIKNEGL